MSGEELDRLDRCAAEVMGYTFNHGSDDPEECWRDASGAEVDFPSVTRDWSAFGELLIALVGMGVFPSVRFSRSRRIWIAEIQKAPGLGRQRKGFHDTDPRVALALAVSAWREGRKGEGGRA